MIQLTVSIIKPDGVKKNLTPVIEKVFTDAGIEIVMSKQTILSKEQALAITGELREQHLLPRIIEYLTSGESKILVLRGENVIKSVRDIIGVTKLSSREGTGLRGLYAEDYLHNTIHGSSTEEGATRDLEVLTPELFGSDRERRY